MVRADWVCLVLLVANLLSCVGSVWLFRRCCRSATLLSRQFISLAAASLAYAILPNATLVIGSMKYSHLEYCSIVVAVVHFCEFAGALTEVHISLGLTVALFRGPRTLEILERTVFGTWPLALALGFLDWHTTTTIVDMGKPILGRCGNRSPVCAVVLCACWVAVFVMYLVSALKSCKSVGENALHRAINRSLYYPFCFIATYGMLVVYNFSGSEAIAWLAFSLASLNGFITAISYSAVDAGITSTSARRLYPVSFRTVASVVDPSSASEPMCSSSLFRPDGSSVGPSETGSTSHPASLGSQLTDGTGSESSSLQSIAVVSLPCSAVV